VASLVYLTTRSNSKLADELMLAGHRVKEALSVSEALFVCENEPVDVVVIAADVEDPDMIEAQMRRVTIKLKPEATVRELLWLLTDLFPDETATVQ
jgi:hypothetical protein